MPLGVRYEPAFVAGFADVLGWPRDCAEPPLHSSGKYPAEDKGCVRALDPKKRPPDRAERTVWRRKRCLASVLSQPRLRCARVFP